MGREQMTNCKKVFKKYKTGKKNGGQHYLIKKNRGSRQKFIEVVPSPHSVSILPDDPSKGGKPIFIVSSPGDIIPPERARIDGQEAPDLIVMAKDDREAVRQYKEQVPETEGKNIPLYPKLVRDLKKLDKEMKI